tara:strand:+ start:785 stop:2065 length:1281 start_codon:yes stop_codon:yes gene_type:complete
MNIVQIGISSLIGAFLGISISRTMDKKEETKVVPAKKPSTKGGASKPSSPPPPRPSFKQKSSEAPAQPVQVSDDVREKIGNLKSPRGLDALPPKDIPTLKISDSGIVEKPEEQPTTMGARPTGQDVEVPLSTLIAMKRGGKSAEEIKKSYNEGRRSFIQEIEDKKMKGERVSTTVEDIERQDKINAQNVKQEDIDKFLTDDEKKQYGIGSTTTMGARPRNQDEEKPNNIIEEVKKNGGAVINAQKGDLKNELETKDETVSTATNPLTLSLCGKLKNRFGNSAVIEQGTGRVIVDGQPSGTSVGILSKTKKINPEYNDCSIPNIYQSQKKQRQAGNTRMKEIQAMNEKTQNPTGMPSVTDIETQLPSSPVNRGWSRVIGITIKDGRGVKKRVSFPYDNWGAIRGLISSQGFLTTQQAQEHLNKYYGN